jgi:pimeloyl-ACP methyl ester carboxylesterase
VVSVLVLVAVVAAVVVVLVVREARDEVDPVRQDVLGPVLLVPGYGGSLSSLQPLRTALEADGRVVEEVPAPGDGTGDLDTQARHLATVAQEAMRANGATSVDVVGYSAGGVVARLWVRDHGGGSVARRVLTLGSPHHGSDVAALVLDGAGSCPPACQELAPDSALLRRLNAGDETPTGPSYISMWSRTDSVSTPPETARLDGALDIPVQSVCPDRAVSHRELPGNPVVLAALRSVLGATAPRAPVDVAC